MNTRKIFFKILLAVILVVLLLAGIKIGQRLIYPTIKDNLYQKQEETYSTKNTTDIEQFCKVSEKQAPSMEVTSKSPFQVKVTKNTRPYEYAPSVLARNEPIQVSKDNKNIVFEIDNTNGIDGSCSYTDSTCTKNIYIMANEIESTQNPRLLYASKNGIEKWVYDSVNNFLYVKENDYNQVIEFTTTSEFFTKVDVLSGNVIYSKKIVSNNVFSISDLTMLSNGDIAELEASEGLRTYDKLNYRTTSATNGTVERIKLENLSDHGGIGSPVLSIDGKYVAFTDGWLSEKGVKVLNVQQKNIEFQDSTMTNIVFLKWITPNVLSLSNNEELLKLIDIKNKTVVMCKK